jgi:hypothetical protein
MCSSRKIGDDVVEITTPSATCNVGDRFLIVGGVAHAVALERQLRKASLSWATWAASLASPAATNSAVVPDPARLAEAQGMGLVHPSLAAEPAGPDQLAA